MPKETKFHGILAVGRTKADAVNNYRLLAMNKGATVQVDSDRQIAFIAQASSADGMFNPMSGNMDLETDDQFIKQLEFNSNSSEQHEVNHLVCKSGCLAHVVFDSESLVKFCPHCTSSLSDDDGEEVDEEEAGEGEAAEEGDESDTTADDEAAEEGDESEPEGDEEADTEDEPEGDEADEEGDEAEGDESEDDAEDSDDEAEEGDEAEGDEEEAEELPEFTEDDGEIVVSSGADDGKIIAVAASFNEAADLFRKHQPQTSISSAKDGMIEATYLVCTSADCGAHILASDNVAECPACQSEVKEPESAPEGVAAAPAAVEPAVAAPAVVEPAAVESSDQNCKSESETEGDDEEGEEDNTLELSDDEGGVLDSDTEELDAMDDMDEDEGEESDSAAKLDVSYSSAIAGSARWTAFYRGIPVAMASKSSAGKNADMFDTPTFGHAVLATAKVSGVRKALKELGFTAIKHRVSVSKAVRKMVNEQVAEQQTALASSQEDFKNRFMAALATAAVGLNRGFFVDQKNPIKGSMWNAMSSAGIRNPESLIDAAFKNHSDAYHKTLFALASDLVSKPVEVQESLSKAIQGMQYQEVSTSASGASIEGRLEGFGTSVSSGVVVKDQPAAPVAVDRSNIKAAVSSLGRGR